MAQFDWGYLLGSLATAILAEFAFLLYLLSQEEDE